MGLNNINSKSTWGQAASDINTNFTTIDSDLKKVKNATTRNKGYFSSIDELKAAFSTANVGDIAYVGSAYPYAIWKWNGSSWANSGSTGGEESVNLGDYYTKVETDEKFTETDAKLSELGQEVDVLYSALDVYSENIEISVFRDNTFVGNDLSVKNYDGYAMSNCIVLQQGEGLVVEMISSASMSAISKMSNSNGLGTPIKMLAVGKGRDYKLYIYTADEDNTYIQLSYNKERGVVCRKTSSHIITSVLSDINRLNDTVIYDSDLKQNRDNEVYPLIQGVYNIADGTIIDHPSRMTTGIILNNKPLSLWINQGYSVAYAYGNSRDNLTDGGYLITNPSIRTKLDVNVDYKYLVFNVVKADGKPFSDAQDSGFFLSKDSANTEIINNKLYNLEVWNKAHDLIDGITRVDGSIYSSTVRKTTGCIDIENEPIYINLSSDYSCVVAHGDSATSLTELGYVIEGGGSYLYDGGKKFIALNITHVSNKDLTDDSIDSLFMCKAESNVGRLAKKLNELETFIPTLKKEQLSKATTISDSKDTLTVSDGWDINDNGIVCASMTAASNTIGEHQTPVTRIALSIANLADIEATKECIDILDPYNYIDGVGYIERAMNSLAKWIDNNYISIFIRVIARVGENIQRYACISCTYNVNTKELSPFALCDIDVLGATYQMYTEFDLNNNGAATSESISKINDIWDKTGIEHPQGYGNKDSYTFYLGQNPKKVYDKFYAAISLGNFSHALCQSSDLNHWEFVCDIPFEQSSEEVAICYYNNRIYATSRGNYDVDQQYSKMMYCPYDSLVKDSWSEPITLAKCRNERPTIVGLNGKIYIMQGYSTKVTIDGMDVARANKVLFVCDTDLNVLKRTNMSFTYPLLHPQFLSYHGNIFACTSTDKRCFAFVGGDSRSEIGISHLDIDILNL